MPDEVPITRDFDDANLDSLMGWATLSDSGKEMIRKTIEAGMLPEFAITFYGEPDENGVYHDAELVSLSMIVREKIK